jgi:hypothetical protein
VNNHNEVVKSMLIFVVIILLVIIVLTGCTNVPVNRKFPEAPSKIVMEGCPNLEKIKDDAKLSDVAKTVTINYSTYYECAVKVDTWVEWYHIQKNIFESIK